jgi:hypothetical protein
MNIDSAIATSYGSFDIFVSRWYYADPFVGVQEVGEDKLWSIYPNPVELELRVVSGSNDPVSYIITDLAGRRIEEGLVTEGIKVSHLKPGAYFISISTQAVIKKFIKF